MQRHLKITIYRVIVSHGIEQRGQPTIYNLSSDNFAIVELNKKVAPENLQFTKR